ncbi:hypothetical protein BC937DRAFT_88381 [Endogone sp. FLAS-F59071]|nr:hypothetical protein BC937DRAFT_88381 [Endogone sp. FLAS-F59071]|eukprot:RUS18757.1 hypothetical protein BC937DRAFT_88381 [Endogone sp. FLAS-F59071]
MKNRQNFVKPANDGLHQIVTEANQLYTRVRHTHEATLDSRLLVLSADLSTQRARNLKLNSTSFDMDEYVSKLVSFMGGRRYDGNDLDWQKMGRVAVKYSSKVPTMDFMLGPLSIEQKARKTHRVTRLEKNRADLVQPQQLKESDMVHNSNQTTDNVTTIEGILMERGPIGFFEFITNPESFSQTVENIFYLSFLIRDGRAKLEDVDGQLMLDYHDPPTNEEYEEGLTKKQLIIDMDMDMWREITEMLDIAEPMIPTRPKQAAISGKWYA